jgi:hypothetical protein
MELEKGLLGRAGEPKRFLRPNTGGILLLAQISLYNLESKWRTLKDKNKEIGNSPGSERIRVRSLLSQEVNRGSEVLRGK